MQSTEGSMWRYCCSPDPTYALLSRCLQALNMKGKYVALVASVMYNPSRTGSVCFMSACGITIAWPVQGDSTITSAWWRANKALNVAVCNPRSVSASHTTCQVKSHSTERQGKLLVAHPSLLHCTAVQWNTQMWQTYIYI